MGFEKKSILRSTSIALTFPMSRQLQIGNSSYAVNQTLCFLPFFVSVTRTVVNVYP